MSLLHMVTLGGVRGEAWSLLDSYYAGLSFSVSSQETDPNMAFSTDGTKMFIVGSTNDTVYQYTLSTAWDVSTATYASKLKVISAQETMTSGIAFSTDGTKMFIVGSTNNTVYQYTLSTAWDVSTATYASKSVSISATGVYSSDITFSTDGTKMYTANRETDAVYQYTLSTAWDVSTATYASKSVSISARDGQPSGIAFSSNGDRMYVVGFDSDTVYQYTLSTAWDVSTATYSSIYKSVSAQEITPNSVAFSTDGTKMFVTGSTSRSVKQYHLT